MMMMNESKLILKKITNTLVSKKSFSHAFKRSYMMKNTRKYLKMYCLNFFLKKSHKKVTYKIRGGAYKKSIKLLLFIILRSKRTARLLINLIDSITIHFLYCC